jgi:hypothetical protein
MELTPTQLKAEIIKELSDNDEVIRIKAKRNNWLKKHLRILDQEIEDDKAEPAVDVLQYIAGVK